MATYRGPPPGVLRLVRLDTMTAIYDRRSNATHVVAEVVPTILGALAQGDAEIPALATWLGTDECTALSERLTELGRTGLVEEV